jgi:competence protein ComEA
VGNRVSPEPQTENGKSGPLLLRSEQAALALLVSVGMVLTVAWWACRGGPRGRLVEIDKAAPQIAGFQVDVNTADWPELAELPGVGKTIATAIIESRQKQGPFRSHDELLRVRGIGVKTLENLRPYLLPITRTEGGGKGQAEGGEGVTR